MVEIDIEYEGALRSVATHGPSGKKLATDAPVDNHGRGETFSPTDLLATGLGSCMLTIMAIAAERKAIDIRGTRVRVQKLMSDTGARRIARLNVTLEVPPEISARVDAATRLELERSVHGCPALRSLSEAIEIPIELRWQS
jgi:putative redox protein